MTCTDTSEDMEAWRMTEEEIELVEQEVKLARLKAKRNALQDGYDEWDNEVSNLMMEAEVEARKIAHDRFHLKRDKQVKDLEIMIGQIKTHPAVK